MPEEQSEFKLKDWFLWLLKYWRTVAIVVVPGFALLVANGVLASLNPNLCNSASTGTLPWPINPGFETHIVGHNHLELIKTPPYYEDPFLHEGIDVMADAGTAIRAVEKGHAVYDLDSAPDTHFALIIESHAKPGTGFLYQHIDYDTLKKHVDDPVEPHEEIGKVVPFPLEDSGNVPFDHLHVEYVEERTANGQIPTSFTYADAWQDYAIVGNPLEKFVPPDDDSPPEILSPSVLCPSATPGAGPYLFTYDGTDEIVDPDGLKVGMKYDIVAHMRDRTHSTSGWDIMPYCVGIQIEKVGGSLDYEHAFQLSGPLSGNFNFDPITLLYEESDCVQSDASYGTRSFYVLVTGSPQGVSHWEPKTEGQYDVTVQARDSTGQGTDVASMRVTVVPSN